ncbi:mCG1040797, partial [Mus musculus]
RKSLINLLHMRFSKFHFDIFHRKVHYPWNFWRQVSRNENIRNPVSKNQKRISGLRFQLDNPSTWKAEAGESR